MEQFEYYQKREQLLSKQGDPTLRVNTNCNWWRIDLLISYQEDVLDINDPFALYIDNVAMPWSISDRTETNLSFYLSGCYECKVCNPLYFYNNAILMRNGTIGPLGQLVESPLTTNANVFSLSITRGYFRPLNK